ncbi:putative integral membrane protein [Carbonactinospora thermoautotrophica]|uniref:Putative integral membrane protein n=1 Tax=Carbonactinospora thermoautotrophica TaxID=1469144 RepID=A0A132MZ08_9ACTN|nr:putative integral membrane protein [Carbonactinospora thermoautotrophica]
MIGHGCSCFPGGTWASLGRYVLRLTIRAGRLVDAPGAAGVPLRPIGPVRC